MLIARDATRRQHISHYARRHYARWFEWFHARCLFDARRLILMLLLIARAAAVSIQA